MHKKKKNTLVSIIIVVLAIGLSSFVLFKCINNYNKQLEIKKQEELIAQQAEEERLERERILNLDITKTIYMCLDEPKEIVLEYLSGDDNFKLYELNGVTYSIATNVGESIVYCKDKDEKYNLVVTDLYELAHIDNYKEEIFLNAYTYEEEALLDAALEYRINEAGYKTRDAVAEAARFLSMMFKYKMPYFCENGRLTGGEDYYCDGEGRFYHKGLYLTDAKYCLIDEDAIVNGPLPWGGYMHYSCGVLEHPNGLDCSGFVSWCLVQAGFDPGDWGAGNNFEGGVFCLADLANGDGGAAWLNDLDPNEIQAGDLIAWDGTTAIVVGVDDEYIYTAHQYWDNGLEVITDTKISLKDYPMGEDAEDWQYVSLMDNYYQSEGNGQGNYTAMWTTKID